jgi:hypothetical protein
MGGPLSVVVLVAAGGAAEPATLAIERAASEALGRTARVVVREAMGAPTDGEALTLGSEANEGAVVEVTWSDRAHRVAMLRVHLAGRRRWMDRTIGFGVADADAERGRTIGLALASMLPDPDPVLPPPEPAAPPVTIPQTAPHGPHPPPAPPAPSPDIAEKTPADVAPRELHYAMDFFGIGAAGLGGNVQTAGGGAALETFLTPRFALRIGGAVRGGPVDGAPARTITLLATAGVELHPWPATASHVFGASLRADYVLMNQTVTHRSASGADLSTMARTLSGIDAMVDLQWRLGANVDLLVGVGAEEMLATTYVDMNGARVATMPPVSLIAEGGLRLRF